jgi:peptidoglycan/xylan/chitin deacetylase (PgdA/CDA1 family)
VRHPHAWTVVAATAVCGAALAGLRTVRGHPARSVPTLAAAGAGMAAGGLMAYEWLTPRSWLYGPVFWRARTSERVIALTFDDGPCHPYTGHLLEILGREGIRATFFQVGNNVIREPNLAAEVASQHEVGNHTFTHPHLAWSRPGTVREEMLRGQEAIHGPQVISVAGELGMRCVGWSVMAWDWGRPPAGVIQRRILHGVGPGGVTLLHDGQDTDAFPEADRSHTVAAVSDIISSLKASGYGFLTLPELMDLDAREHQPG